MKPQSDSPDSADSLVFECDFAEPPEKVWRALTEPQLLEAWLADDPPQADSASKKAAPEQPPPAEYEVVTAEPHHLLRYRWRDREVGSGDSGGREVHSVVTFELTPCQTGGTHLRLTHGEFTLVAVAMTANTARVTPITNARCQRTPIVSCAMPISWRRAA